MLKFSNLNVKFYFILLTLTSCSAEENENNRAQKLRKSADQTDLYAIPFDTSGEEDRERLEDWRQKRKN